MSLVHPQALSKPLESVVGASWLYPFKGIYFFAANPAWWPLLGRRLIPLAVVSIVVFGFLFTFAYLPQVAFLALFGHGPGAFLNAAFLVLGEGAVIIALLFEALLVDETLVDVFDAVNLVYYPSTPPSLIEPRCLLKKVSKTSSHQPASSIITPQIQSRCWVSLRRPSFTPPFHAAKYWSSSFSCL